MNYEQANLLIRLLEENNQLQRERNNLLEQINDKLIKIYGGLP